MKSQTFIFIHDQDLLLKYLDAGKFNQLPNLKYVFVGNRPHEKIETLNNVIISKKLKLNIEKYPNLNSFTGWYSVWKNNLIDSDTNYINLFEYDIDLLDDFIEKYNGQINEDLDFIGYIPHPMGGFNYVNNLNWVKEIIPSIKKHYNIDVYGIISSILNSNPNEVWSCTSNSTFNKKSFTEYMVWFEKLIDDINLSPNAGHAHERSISFFYLIYKKRIKILNNTIRHYQLDSHKTQGHFVDYDSSVNKLLKN